MFRNLARLYSRRIVNVNVNVLLSGLLALGPTVVAVRLTKMWLHVSNPDQLGHPEKLLITGVTFVTDVTFDVTIYYCLHWLANHLPRRLKVAEVVLDASHVPFMKDASVVQMQRAIISPVLYICWLGTQYVLIGRVGGWETVIGWCVGITAARTLHTIWMIRAQKWAKGKFTAAVQAVVPSAPPDPPPAPGTPPAAGSPPPPR